VRNPITSLVFFAIVAASPAWAAHISKPGQTTQPVPPQPLETAVSATHSWTGAAGTKWSNPSNWSPAGVPKAGDSLVFGENPMIGMDPVAVNDLPGGLAFASITGKGGSFTISGNPIAISGTISADSRLNVEMPVDLGAGGHAVQSVSFLAPVAGSGTLTGTASFTTPIQQPFTGTLEGVGSWILGSDLSSTRFNNARIVGYGKVGALTGSVQIQPMQLDGAPGVFTTGAFQADGGYLFAMLEEDVGSRIEVQGPVRVEGIRFLPQTPGDFAPVSGKVYVLIANDGTDPISGTLRSYNDGTPYFEGSVLQWGEYDLRISYVGGDGNDLTITATRAR
jgi:fibronectin-binding autotransporter adhesin